MLVQGDHLGIQYSDTWILGTTQLGWYVISQLNNAHFTMLASYLHNISSVLYGVNLRGNIETVAGDIRR